MEKNLDKLNWKNYIQRYPDLRSIGIDTKEKAIAHYVKYGQKEKFD